MSKAPILDYKQCEQKLARIAAELQEKLYGHQALLFIGIGEKGCALSEQICGHLSAEIKTTILPAHKQSIPDGDFLPSVDFKDKTVVVVDDVLESGRTLMHVCSAIMIKKPQQIKTVILVDRMHPRFPIKADVVGVTLSTTLQNHVDVRFDAQGISAYLE